MPSIRGGLRSTTHWCATRFNMATDKHEITRFLDGGQTPARTLVPPFGGYEGVETLPVEAGGRIWDVLSYDPEAARELMRRAGAGRVVYGPDVSKSHQE